MLFPLTKGYQEVLNDTSDPGYSVPALTGLVLAAFIHFDNVPLVIPYPVGQVTLFTAEKFPIINLLPLAILTRPDVNSKAFFILILSASQITLGDAVDVLVTSNVPKTLTTLLEVFTPATEPPTKPAGSTVTV